jgi:hypothetical protein
VLGAKGTHGFCGAMVNAVKLARFKARRNGGRVTLQGVKDAQLQMTRGTKIELLVKKGLAS